MTAGLGASVLASLDLFLVNLAFAQISGGFAEASPQMLSWVLNAYLIAFGVFLTPAGRIADRFGRRRVLRLGLLLFGVATLAASFAPIIEILITARALQGVGAAMIVPTSLALLLQQTDDPHRKRIISIWAAAGSVAAAIGPVLGGVLADADWRLVFMVKLPFVLITLLATRAFAKDERTLSAGKHSAGFGLWSYLRPTFLSAVLGMTAFYFGFAILLLAGALWSTNVWGWSSAAAGLAFVAGPATAVVTALIAGRSSIDARWFAMVAGGLFLVCGLFWAFAMSPTEPAIWVLLSGLVVTGAAAGIGQTGFLAVATTALPKTQHATATGVMSTARQLGSALGVAVLFAIVGLGGDGAKYQLAWLVMGAAGVLAALTSIFPVKRFARRGTSAGEGLVVRTAKSRFITNQ